MEEDRYNTFMEEERYSTEGNEARKNREVIYKVIEHNKLQQQQQKKLQTIKRQT